MADNRNGAKDRASDHSWSGWFRDKMLAPLLLAAIGGAIGVYLKIDGLDTRMGDRFTIMEQRINSRMDMQDIQMKQQKEEITRLSASVTAVQNGYVSRDELLNSFKKVEQQWHIERLEKELSRKKPKEAM